MRRGLLFSLALGAVVVSPRVGHATSGTTGRRALSTFAKAHQIPAWARRYNMNCDGCHYPTVPRLNATGLRFKWAGYRMPEDIGKNAEVKKIEQYVAARGMIQYVYSKTSGQPADSSTLTLPSASLFAGGSLGTNYGAYVEFERTPDAAVDLVGQAVGVWGKENSYVGLKAGQGHMIVGGAIAGFDRPEGILAPLPLDAQGTTGVPFRFTGDVAGIEAFYVWGGRNRTSVQFVNSLTGAGGEGMDVTTSATRHDWVVTNQFMWDDMGSGITTIGYFGAVDGLDTTQMDLKSKYYRLAVSANKYVGPFEAQAGYVYSGNSDLPVGANSMFSASSITGTGYWLSGGYTNQKSFFTIYGRYEFLNPDRNMTDAGTRRVVLGSLLPVAVPEYLRLGLEYFQDQPQLSGAPSRQGVTAEVHVAF